MGQQAIRTVVDGVRACACVAKELNQAWTEKKEYSNTGEGCPGGGKEDGEEEGGEGDGVKMKHRERDKG